jgi:hypothetical protein
LIYNSSPAGNKVETQIRKESKVKKIVMQKRMKNIPLASSPIALSSFNVESNNFLLARVEETEVVWLTVVGVAAPL